VVAAQGAPASRTSSEQGVTVTVRSGSFAPDAKTWNFEIVLDTHSQDLGADLVKSAVLLPSSRERHATVADERTDDRPDVVPPNEMETIMRLAKPLFASLLVAGALASAHAQVPAPADKSAKPAPSMPGGPGMMGMDMSKMQERMKTMQAQMDKLRATTDPAERQKLMQEHMSTMQDAMKDMRGMGGPTMGMMGGGMMAGGAAGKAPSTKPPGSPDQRMRMMEQRMDMMQMMLDQLMQHEEMMQRK